MPIRNAKRPTMISEGEIVGLTDKEKKILEDAGIAGGNEIPEITLTPTSMSPNIEGTVNDEQLETVRNNEVIKFILPSVMDVTATKLSTNGSSNPEEYVFYFYLADTFYTLEIVAASKSFRIFIQRMPLGLLIQDSKLGLYDNTSSIFGGSISKTNLRDFLGDKYTISEDGDTLVITENY